MMRYLLLVVVIGSLAAASFQGCAGSGGTAATRGGGDGRRSSEGLAKEIAAIAGTKVERTGDAIEVTLDSDTLFGNNSAMLTLESERTVEAIAGVLARHPGDRIVVSAHTDSIGPTSYKMKMTERQALSIGEILIDAGVPPSQIETEGFGDTRPAATNATAAGRRANRRVAIDILPEKAETK